VRSIDILPPPNASRYGGGFLRSAPSLISRRRDFPGVRPGSFYPFQQVLPCFLDIDRCVDVSVVAPSTSWTVPFAHSQRQFIQQMATPRTQLRRRKEPIQRKIGSAVPECLVFQFSEYLSERRINDVFGKIVIPHHSGHVQSFDKDRLVLADDPGRELLKRVAPCVADSGVKSGYFELGFLTIITAFDFARQSALKSLQSLFSSDQWTGIFYLLAFTGRGERLDADINADFSFSFLQGLDVGLDQNAHKIAPGCIATDRQAEHLGIVRQWTTPRDIQWLRLLGQRDLAVSKSKSIGRIASRLVGAPGFESWIFSPLLKEVCEGRIEIAERLLKRYRTDFGKKSSIRILFPFSKLGCGFVIADKFLFLLPGHASQFQCLIVNISRAAEGASQLRGLFVSGEESVFESLFDYHERILYSTRPYCNRVNRGPKRPRCQIHLHPSSRYGWSILWRIR
jgi:hypothetical protein